MEKAKVDAKEYFKKLKEAPYPLYIAPKPYSFDLNEDMIKMLRGEFNADVVSDKLAKAIKGKAKGEIEKAGGDFFTDLGEKWMKRTIQLGEEYSDRTIEMVLESVDHQGNQYMIFPHVMQRFVEIAYLSTQEFLKVPITLNNKDALQYRIPRCALFGKIKEKCGEEVANLMTCKNCCLTALATAQKHTEIDMLIEQLASTAKDGFCEFSMKKL